MNSSNQSNPRLSRGDKLQLILPSYAAIGSAAAFFLPTISFYAETPEDPQKAVGYVFIAGYSALIGLLSGAGLFIGISARKTLPSAAKTLSRAIQAVGLFSLAALLFTLRFPQ